MINIEFVSKPAGAQVTLDGKVVCKKAPCTREVSPGRHRVAMTLARSGNCFGAFQRYGYDVETGQCEPFLWGGCGGNANNFETQEACESACASAGPSGDG